MWGSIGSQVSCGNGSKRLFHQTSILLPFHNVGLLVGSCRQNWEGSIAFKASRSLGLNRTFTEGCRTPGQSSVALASLSALYN